VRAGSFAPSSGATSLRKFLLTIVGDPCCVWRQPSGMIGITSNGWRSMPVVREVMIGCGLDDTKVTILYVNSRVVKERRYAVL